MNNEIRVRFIFKSGEVEYLTMVELPEVWFLPVKFNEMENNEMPQVIVFKRQFLKDPSNGAISYFYEET